MAGVTQALPEMAPASQRLFSWMARAQYAALARMRFCILRNTVRSTRGALEFGAQAVLLIMFAIMGLGMAFGLGAGAFAIASKGNWEFLPILFWVVCVLWQILPVVMASYQQQFDMNALLRFPVGFGTFCVLHLVFGLVDSSTIVGGLGCLGIFVGATIARQDLAGWTAVSLVVFAAFNLFLARAILAWIDRWLAQRKSREIMTALFFLLILSINFFNPAFHRQGKSEKISREYWAQSMRWVDRANMVQHWLPPGLAARVVNDGADRHSINAVRSLGLTGLYMLAAAGILGIRLGAEFRGENLGEAPSRKKAEKRTGQWLLDGSGPVAAVVEKELRLLMRAVPLMYALAAPLLLVFLFSGVYHMKNPGNLPIVLLVCMAYGLVGFTQLLYNNLGTEGVGIQLLFMSPTPIRTVMLAKNLFHSGLFALESLLICAIAFWRFGLPAPLMLAAIISWLLFAVPVHLAAGNIFSLTMPYRINMGRIGRQSGSQANAMLSLLIQVGVLGVGAAVFLLCSFFKELWLATPVFLLFAGAALFGWFRVLANLDRLANDRREELISRLVKAE